jgi:hypothetical protein
MIGSAAHKSQSGRLRRAATFLRKVGIERQFNIREGQARNRLRITARETLAGAGAIKTAKVSANSHGTPAPCSIQSCALSEVRPWTVSEASPSFVTHVARSKLRRELLRRVTLS